jgi:hypothetical protein
MALVDEPAQLDRVTAHNNTSLTRSAAPWTFLSLTRLQHVARGRWSSRGASVRVRARVSVPAPMKKNMRGGGYGDEKVANRDTKVWHGATENGP